MMLVCFLPKVMVWLAFILAIVLLVITGILFLVDNNEELIKAQGWAIFLALVAFFMAIILLVYVLINRKSIKYCGVFLQNSRLMLKESCLTFLYILLFMILTFVFGILIVFQYLAFVSSTSPAYSESSLYPELSRTFWFMCPLVIETIWGLSFLRDACTLIVT